MSGFSFENSPSQNDSKNLHHHESTPIITNGDSTNTLANNPLKHSNSSSTLISRGKLTRKLSEQKEVSYVTSPEEFIHKYCGNHVIKKVGFFDFCLNIYQKIIFRSKIFRVL